MEETDGGGLGETDCDKACGERVSQVEESEERRLNNILLEMEIVG